MRGRTRWLSTTNQADLVLDRLHATRRESSPRTPQNEHRWPADCESVSATPPPQLQPSTSSSMPRSSTRRLPRLHAHAATLTSGWPRVPHPQRPALPSAPAPGRGGLIGPGRGTGTADTDNHLLSGASARGGRFAAEGATSRANGRWRGLALDIRLTDNLVRTHQRTNAGPVRSDEVLEGKELGELCEAVEQGEGVAVCRSLARKSHEDRWTLAVVSLAAVPPSSPPACRDPSNGVDTARGQASDAHRMCRPAALRAERGRRPRCRPLPHEACRWPSLRCHSFVRGSDPTRIRHKAGNPNRPYTAFMQVRGGFGGGGCEGTRTHGLSRVKRTL